MSWGTVHVTYSLSARLAFLITFAYSLWWVLFGWRSSRPAIVALIPFALNASVVWVMYVNVTRGVSFSGGGRGALSAGLAEALFSLMVGTLVTLVLALIGAVRGPRHGEVRDTVASMGVLAGSSAVTIGFARYLSALAIFDPAVLKLMSMAAPTFAVTMVAFLLIAARKRLQPAPLGIAAIMVLIALATWQQIETYRRIAMTPPSVSSVSLW